MSPREIVDLSDSPEEQALTESRNLAIEVAQLAEDRHLTDIVVLELAGRSPVAKHFVICTGTSNQQIRSVGSEIGKVGKDAGFTVFGKSGLQKGQWVVIDFVDVVVHLFEPDFRTYYDLEMLWGDAPRVAWERPERDSEPTA